MLWLYDIALYSRCCLNFAVYLWEHLFLVAWFHKLQFLHQLINQAWYKNYPWILFNLAFCNHAVDAWSDHRFLVFTYNLLTFPHLWIKFFFYLGFLSWPFANHRTTGEGEGHFFNFSLPLPPTSQTLRHESGDYWIELTSAHS